MISFFLDPYIGWLQSASAEREREREREIKQKINSHLFSFNYISFIDVTVCSAIPIDRSSSYI